MKYLYFWIDPDIDNTENQKLLKILEKSFNIKGLATIVGFIYALKSLNPCQKIRIICSSALKQEEYIYLQSEQKVEQIILYCNFQANCSILKQKHNKIKTSFIDPIALKNYMSK